MSDPTQPESTPLPPAETEKPRVTEPPVEDETATPAKIRLDPTRYGDWELNGKCVDF